MKKILGIVILCILTYSCSYQFRPFEGSYPDRSSIISSKSIDECWNITATYLSLKGYKAILIDKQNWIIETKEISFIKNYTFENKNYAGGSIDSKAYFVIAYISINSGTWDQDEPLYIKASIKIQFKSEISGTSISFKISPYAIKINSYRENRDKGFKKWDLAVKSTGVLEKEFFDQFK